MQTFNESMRKSNLLAAWMFIQRSISIQLTLFILIAIVLFFIGLMIGFLINQDNILNALNPQFWEDFQALIGGNS